MSDKVTKKMVPHPPWSETVQPAPKWSEAWWAERAHSVDTMRDFLDTAGVLNATTKTGECIIEGEFDTGQDAVVLTGAEADAVAKAIRLLWAEVKAARAYYGVGGMTTFGTLEQQVAVIRNAQKAVDKAKLLEGE